MNCVPEPRLERLENHTSLQLFQCDKMGVGRRFFDIIVVKGSFAIGADGLRLADEQAPIALADEVWDATHPERSSLKQAGDLVLGKLATDVLVTGSARAPSGRPEREWQASVSVWRGGARMFGYSVKVTGPRWWRHTAWGWSLTDAEPRLAVPIRYELAYGGAYHAAEPSTVAGELRVHEPNPSGLGFLDVFAVDDRRDYAAPQWEERERPVTFMNQEAALAGFGPIARPWASRLGYAGTYDDAWERRMIADIAAGLPADYPADFDARFFQCAHPQLIAPGYLAPGDEIELAGLFATERTVSLRLPASAVVAELRNGAGDSFQHALALDTVAIDVDRAMLHATWRLTLDQGYDIRSAAIHQQEMS